jgi:hypothetical protein
MRLLSNTGGTIYTAYSHELAFSFSILSRCQSYRRTGAFFCLRGKAGPVFCPKLR